jgi:hypothetical protein
LIVACISCSARYTVPDAKVRGRKLRATCKRCRTPFVIDGTATALEPSSIADAPVSMAADAGDDATRVAYRPDFSVHDEQTVVGQIPAWALEAERRHAQRTAPPPANEPATVATSEPLLPGRKSSPSAPAERELPVYTSDLTQLGPAPSASSARPAPPSRETTPISASDLAPVLTPSRKRTAYLLAALATVAVTAVIIAIATR